MHRLPPPATQRGPTTLINTTANNATPDTIASIRAVMEATAPSSGTDLYELEENYRTIQAMMDDVYSMVGVPDDLLHDIQFRSVQLTRMIANRRRHACQSPRPTNVEMSDDNKDDDMETTDSEEVEEEGEGDQSAQLSAAEIRARRLAFFMK